MEYEGIDGVPKFICEEYQPKTKEYVLLIPVINEGEKIIHELERAKNYNISDYVDIVICDGNSSDGSIVRTKLEKLMVNTVLIKQDDGKQGAQLRMGIWWSIQRGYKGIITVDGNDKDSIEDTPKFIGKLEEGYDFIQGSRFIKGGKAINTPIMRYLSIKCIHAPIISITAHRRFTDTTNNFRGYSMQYIKDKRVQPLRDIFVSYELLAYFSVRATQLGYKVCEIPVTRAYPSKGRTPTKIRFFKGNKELLKILLNNWRGLYNPLKKNI